MFQTKVVERNQNKHFMLNNFAFRNRGPYEIFWKNITQPRRTQMTM